MTQSPVSFTFTKLTLYRPVIDHMVNSPDGEVGRDLRKRGQRVLVAAKRQVGADTGKLRASIKMMHLRDSRGQYLWIGSRNKVAYLHHEGTRRHIILPKRHEVLRFSSGGRVIYSRRVVHPGTRPNRYLSDNLRLVRT